jgi:hypothetical protein
MSDRYTRPDWVRRLNAMADACGGPDHVVPIEAGALVDTAQASTGLDDFGDFGDGDWPSRFAALVDAINAAGLHVVGRLMTREELLRGLRTRLLMARRWREEPAIAAERIVGPIIVTGPARSGTTILFELLGLDPTLRSPRAADALHPALPTGTTDTQRLAMTECEQELWADVQPEFAAIHELRSDLPVECVTINLPSFAGSHWFFVLQDIGSWVPDLDADFAFHRAVLQTLQHGKPERPWLLKTPGYLMTLDAVLAAYPDARIVLTHRDPARTMPSTVSTTATVKWLRNDDVDLDALAATIGAAFGGALLDVTQRRRDGWMTGRFGDVHFRSLLAEPAEAIAAAFAQLGIDRDPRRADDIARYLADKPQGKFGVHRYDAAEWGFDANTLYDDLRPYTDYFDVELEV